MKTNKKELKKMKKSKLPQLTQSFNVSYIVQNIDGFVYQTQNYELATMVAKDKKGRILTWNNYA